MARAISTQHYMLPRFLRRLASLSASPNEASLFLRRISSNTFFTILFQGLALRLPPDILRVERLHVQGLLPHTLHLELRARRVEAICSTVLC